MFEKKRSCGKSMAILSRSISSPSTFILCSQSGEVGATERRSQEMIEKSQAILCMRQIHSKVGPFKSWGATLWPSCGLLTFKHPENTPCFSPFGEEKEQDENPFESKALRTFQKASPCGAARSSFVQTASR